MKKRSTCTTSCQDNAVRSRLKARGYGPTKVATLAKCSASYACTSITTGRLSGRLREVIRDLCKWTDLELEVAIRDITENARWQENLCGTESVEVVK